MRCSSALPKVRSLQQENSSLWLFEDDKEQRPSNLRCVSDGNSTAELYLMGCRACSFMFLFLQSTQCLYHESTCGHIFSTVSPLHRACGSDDATATKFSGGSTDEVICLVGDIGDLVKRPLESRIDGGMAATLTSDGNLGLFGNAAADDMKKRPYSGNGCSDSFGASSDERAQKKMTTTSVLGEKSGLECSPDDLQGG